MAQKLLSMISLSKTVKDTKSVIILKCEVKLYEERMINPH